MKKECHVCSCNVERISNYIFMFMPDDRRVLNTGIYFCVPCFRIIRDIKKTNTYKDKDRSIDDAWEKNR